MKKGIVIAVGVLALLALMVWVDHKFPPANVPGAAMSSATTPNTSIDASNVAVKDLNDHNITLADYKGKVVLVNFWATWCAPCKGEIPMLIGLQEKYGPRGFTILGLSMDEEGKKAVQPFLDKERFDVNGKQEPINYPIALANDSIAEKFGGIMGLPTSMLFTRDGKEVRKVIGAINEDDMAKAVEGAL